MHLPFMFLGISSKASVVKWPTPQICWWEMLSFQYVPMKHGHGYDLMLWTTVSKIWSTELPSFPTSLTPSWYFWGQSKTHWKQKQSGYFLWTCSILAIRALSEEPQLGRHGSYTAHVFKPLWDDKFLGWPDPICAWSMKFPLSYWCPLQTCNSHSGYFLVAKGHISF